MIPNISKSLLPSSMQSSELSMQATRPGLCAHGASSTVTMGHSWSPFRCLFSLINQLYWVIKSLFCCCRYRSHHRATFVPEVDPKNLSSRDSFYRTVFESNGSLKHREAHRLISEIFSILGEGGLFHWKRHQSEIKKKKKAIVQMGIHPLESLYLMFHNREITGHVCHFLDNASFGIDTRFVKEHASKLDAKRSSIPSHVSGFCELLQLDEPRVSKLVSNRDWKTLIRYVHKTRKEHFNL